MNASATIENRTRDQVSGRHRLLPLVVSGSVVAELARLSTVHCEEKSMSTSVALRTSPLDPDAQTCPMVGT
jgi:hypothetical protein